VDSEQLIWLFFRLSGRVGRAAYFLAGLLLFVVQAFILYRFMQAPEESTASMVLALIFWVVVIVSIWCGVALGVKRLHDFGQPGIVAASLFVPVLSYVVFIVLCLYPSDPGPNRFGALTNAPRR